MSSASVVSGRARPANGGNVRSTSIVRASAASPASPAPAGGGPFVHPAPPTTADQVRLATSHRQQYSGPMYFVTKRIDFCYGHRLLDYDGICKHPHGHNAVVEVDDRTDQLDTRNMVADFSDIKRIVKGWIDRELDHKMILRQDDPLVAPLKTLGEPVFLLEGHPTPERTARLIFEYASSQAFPVVCVKVREKPTP